MTHHCSLSLFYIIYLLTYLSLSPYLSLSGDGEGEGQVEPRHIIRVLETRKSEKKVAEFLAAQRESALWEKVIGGK